MDWFKGKKIQKKNTIFDGEIPWFPIDFPFHQSIEIPICHLRGGFTSRTATCLGTCRCGRPRNPELGSAASGCCSVPSCNAKARKGLGRLMGGLVIFKDVMRIPYPIESPTYEYCWSSIWSILVLASMSKLKWWCSGFAGMQCVQTIHSNYLVGPNMGDPKMWREKIWQFIAISRG
jgi:hypothetical protein